MERLSALWRTPKPKPSSPAPRVVEQGGLSCLIRPWPLSGESDQRKSTGEEGGLRQLCRGGIFALWVIRRVCVVQAQNHLYLIRSSCVDVVANGIVGICDLRCS